MIVIIEIGYNPSSNCQKALMKLFQQERVVEQVAVTVMKTISKIMLTTTNCQLDHPCNHLILSNSENLQVISNSIETQIALQQLEANNSQGQVLRTTLTIGIKATIRVTNKYSNSNQYFGWRLTSKHQQQQEQEEEQVIKSTILFLVL